MDEMRVNLSDVSNAIEMLVKSKNEGLLLDGNKLVQAYKMRGLLYMQTEFFLEAMNDYNKAFEIIEDMRKNNNHIDENVLAEIHAAKGIIYFRLGEFQNASLDTGNSINIWKSLLIRGLPINEEMLESIEEINALIITYSNDDKNKSLEYFCKSIDDDENLKNIDQSLDISRLANKYYFNALNYIQTEEKNKAIVNLNKCIDLFNEIGMQNLNNDDKKILSSAYMCRGELYFQIDEDDDALNDYNCAVTIEELLKKDGVELNNYDIMDIIRLYTGRANVLEFLGNDGVIDDYIIALRFNKSVFNTFPQTQEDYYYYLDKLVDYLIEKSFDKICFNNIIQEFLFSLFYDEKTEEATKLQIFIHEKVKPYIN